MALFCDALFLTFIPFVEDASARVCLGLARDQPPDHIHDGVRYWFADLVAHGGNLRIALACVAHQGSYSSASTTSKAIGLTSPKIAVLIGICAGLPDRTNYGDVIASFKVIGYEPARVQSGGLAIQPDHLEPPFALWQDLEFFKERQWTDDRGRIFAALCLQQDRKPPAVHCAVIASGEKLLADGVSLDDLRTKFHEKIRGADKEAMGFASACRRRRDEVPWIVIKGVSDFGGADKDRKDDESTRQLRAAANAALFAREFVLNREATGGAANQFLPIRGRGEVLKWFRSVFIDNPGDGGHIDLLSSVGGWPSFDPFDAIEAALGRNARVRVVLQRSMLDDWMKCNGERGRRLLFEPRLSIYVLNEFKHRHLRIGMNDVKSIAFIATSRKEAVQTLEPEGFATREPVLVECVQAVFQAVIAQCEIYRPHS